MFDLVYLLYLTLAYINTTSTTLNHKIVIKYSMMINSRP